MKLFDNGVYFWEDLVLGMVKALVSEARNRLEEDGVDTYDEILHKIDENCVNRDVVTYLVRVATDFHKSGYFKHNSEDEGFDLFFDLYYGKYRKGMNKLLFNKYSDEFSNRTPMISDSIYDDVRVFFE